MPFVRGLVGCILIRLLPPLSHYSSLRSAGHVRRIARDLVTAHAQLAAQQRLNDEGAEEAGLEQDLSQQISEELDATLGRIHVTPVFQVYHALQAVEQISALQGTEAMPSLVVVDSMTALIAPILGGDKSSAGACGCSLGRTRTCQSIFRVLTSHLPWSQS